MRLQKTGPRQIPPDRRCTEILTNGQQCGCMTVAGQKWCHQHGLYRDLYGSSSVDVPLLENDDAILLVTSQTARSLAQGRIPTANANGILRACHIAQRALDRKLRTEELEERRLARAEKAGNTSGNQIAEPEPEQELATAPVDSEGTADPAENPASATAATDLSACEEPQPWTVPPERTWISPVQFSDVRQKFDDSLARMEGDWLDLYLKRSRAMRERGETPPSCLSIPIA